MTTAVTNRRDQLMRVPVTPELIDYILDHGSPLDEVQKDLIARTREKFSDHAGMQVAPEQGALLEMFTRIIAPRSVVEVGTFTGYSSLCIARALPEGGRLLCCDISTEWTDLARQAWERAGVADRIELRIAPALETLRSLPEEETIDMSFVDADKGGYWNYFEELVKRTRPGGVLLFDNTLYAGMVLRSDVTGNPAAIREFNDRIAADDRVDVVMLPLADGLTVARKR